MLSALTRQLGQGQSLSDEQVAEAVRGLTTAEINPVEKAEFLAALAQKGETIEEIRAFAAQLRTLSIVPPLDADTRRREILDVCGTGGDRLNTFNISTTVALVVAAAGVTVAKHGNRAITSQSGSADVLEALGIKIELSPEETARALRDHHFAFFFAAKYHPAFQQIGPARKLCAEKGQRTIFNFLGPLLNPARPTMQLMGVSRPDLCEPVGRVLQALGTRRGMIVCGMVGDKHLDELSTLGDSTVAEFYQERGFSVSTLSPNSFPILPATLEDLAGGDKWVNAKIVTSLLHGEERGPKRDAVLLNCAAALMIAEKAKSLTEGWELAARVIDSGKARAKLKDLQTAA